MSNSKTFEKYTEIKGRASLPRFAQRLIKEKIDDYSSSISATLLALFLSAGLVSCSPDKDPCDTLPEGWEIVTDGTAYRFKFPSGNISIFDKEDESEAIVAACRQKKHRDGENSREWRTNDN